MPKRRNLMDIGNRILIAGGVLTGVAALLHIAMILGGADWYRFFGAGEEMAKLAASGSTYPAMNAAGIAIILGIWTLYAFSGAGMIRRLPFLRSVLALIAVVFIMRGVIGVPMVLLMDDPYAIELRARMMFVAVTSVIIFSLGLSYAIGSILLWRRS
jgi:putative oxidoreductase